MSAGGGARNPDPDQANRQLSQGLKSCRSVINNYRAMLLGDRGISPQTSDDPPARTDVGGSAIDETSVGSPD